MARATVGYYGVVRRPTVPVKPASSTAKTPSWSEAEIAEKDGKQADFLIFFSVRPYQASVVGGGAGITF